MTKKDYVKIAKVLNDHKKELARFAGADPDLWDVFSDLVQGFRVTLEQDNSLFNWDLFYKAVYHD